MSKFFKALERAEEERALEAQTQQPEPGPQVTAPATDVPSAPATPSEELQGAPRDTGGGRGIDPHFVSLLSPSTLEAEQYRTLRYMVERAHNTKGSLCVVAISSPAPGDGKTTTAINLAGALAQGKEARVLLVDADLRRPSVPARLGWDSGGGRGLVDAILHTSLNLHDVVRRCPAFNLAVLPAGRSTTASYEILKAARLGELLAAARRNYDYIVLDTPPLLPFPDCRLIGKWVDGFCVVVGAHKTPRKLVEAALNVVEPEQLLGLVFNGDDRPVFGYASYYGYRDLSAYGYRDLFADTRGTKKSGGLRQRGSAKHDALPGRAA
ncbi:MAG: CpsD/CapB family tyrosine-protein kinase [Deltaproteobacteria bacterium]|nr:CpsD/CapB family tyrosine-protein kinase [Deltaproteobacteria bacterium]